MKPKATDFTRMVKPVSDPYKHKPIEINNLTQTVPTMPVVVPDDSSTPANIQPSKIPPNIQSVDANLARSVSYLADFAGCGHYRILWPNWLINAKYTTPKNGRPTFSVMSSASMIFEPNIYYNQMKVVRVQRQATQQQMDFLRHFLVPLAKKKNFKIVYDADDWFFNIPKFNHAYKAYTPEILNNIVEIVTNMDYLTVTSSYLRNLFHKEINIPIEKILLMPNRLPKFLYEGYYDKDKVKIKSKKKRVSAKDKPRILWTGSSTHFNLGDMSSEDDVKVLRQFIHKTAKRYQWVLVGVPKDAVKYLGLPSNVECYPWCPILNYPMLMDRVDCDLAITALYDCDFNRAKSNIKLLEFGALGIPAVLERVEPYKTAPCTFRGLAELEAQVDRLLKDEKYYYNTVAQQRGIVEKNFWLEDHIEDWCDLYQGNFDLLKEKTKKELSKIV